jgi:hypothetical protein
MKTRKTLYALKKLAVQPLIKLGEVYNYPAKGRSRTITGRRVKAVRYEKHTGGIWVVFKGIERVVSPFALLGIDARTYVIAHR